MEPATKRLRTDAHRHGDDEASAASTAASSPLQAGLPPACQIAIGHDACVVLLRDVVSFIANNTATQGALHHANSVKFNSMCGCLVMRLNAGFDNATTCTELAHLLAGKAALGAMIAALQTSWALLYEDQVWYG